MEIKVYYEDTDCGQVVYYANYLKYFERARTEHMNRRGIDLKLYHEQGFFFVVARALVDYRSPGRYGDTLVVETRISEISRVSFTFRYRVVEKESKRLIAEGETKIVMVDKHLKPRRLDEDLVVRLKAEK